MAPEMGRVVHEPLREGTIGGSVCYTSGMNAAGGLFRYFRGAHMARKGRRLLASGDFEQAREALGQALLLLGRDEPSGASVGVWFSERIMALRDLSYAAAKAGDVELARDSIREGLAIWDKWALAPSEKFAAIEEWKCWAKEYLAWSAGRDSPK